jgi:cytochrome oxidase Cu insertion factor (SCO1/SenC/PrrC family)
MRRVAIAGALVAIGFLSLFIVLALRGGDGRERRSEARDRYIGSKLPEGLTMPAFRLRDYRGGVVSNRELHGRVSLITFLDTDCRTQCPIVAAAIGAGLRLLNLPERRAVSAIAVTVNPPRDTPIRVRHFLRSRHALSMNYLIGTTEQLRPVWKRFGVLAVTETGDADIHSSDVRVFNRRRRWVTTMHAGVDLSPRALAHDIRAALRGVQPTH